MAERKNFIVRGEHREALSLLSQEDKGTLLDAMFSYNLDGKEPVLDGMIKMAFAFMKNSFDSDKAAYEAQCERNKQNGQRGGRPKKEKPTGPQMDNNKASGSGKNPENPAGNIETDPNPENPAGYDNARENQAGYSENPENKGNNADFNNPVGFSETDPNRPEPKKANTNTKSNTNTNSIPPYIPPEGTSVGCDRDFPKEWDRLRMFWNSSGLPEYKKLFVNLSNAGEVKNWMGPYTVEELQGAITNYRKLLPRIPPTEKKYDTFFGFIRSGVDRFHEGVKPADRYETPEEEKVSACPPEPLPEISDEERAEVQEMMEAEGGILGMIAKNREAAHASC